MACELQRRKEISMAMACPECKTWTEVKQTRSDEAKTEVKRRYQCANGHRFSTLEKVAPSRCNEKKNK